MVFNFLKLSTICIILICWYETPALAQCTGQFKAGQVCGTGLTGGLPQSTYHPVFGNATNQGTIVLYPGSGAPGGLVNGELWTTNTGLFARINGSTVPLGTGLVPSGTFTINDFLCADATSATPAIIDCGLSSTATNNWSGIQNFNGGVTVNGVGITVNPTAASTVKGIDIEQSGPASGSTSTTINYNNIIIASDSNNNANNLMRGLNIDYGFGGSNFQGAATGLNVYLHQNNTGNPANPNPFAAAATFTLEAFNPADNATAAVTGVNPFILLQSGATGYHSIIGEETSIGALSPGAADFRAGYNVQSIGTQQGITGDYAIIISSAGPAKWQNGIFFSHFGGIASLSTTGCIICSDTNTDTVASFADFHTYDITGDILFFSKFRVTGAGITTIEGPTSGSVTSLNINNQDTTHNAEIILYAGGVAKWEMGKGTTGNFFVYDNVAAQNVINVVANGGMTISPVGPIGLATSTTISGPASGSNTTLTINNQDATHNAEVIFDSASSPKWEIGKDGSGNFFVFDNTGAQNVISITANDGISITPVGSLILGSSSNKTVNSAGQIISTTGIPTIASGACGTTTNGAVLAGSTNQSGSITIGAAATTNCTISWSVTLSVKPSACTFFPNNAAAADTVTTVAYISSLTTTEVILTGSALANANYMYICL